MTLQNVRKIKGATDINGLKNVKCKQGLSFYNEMHNNRNSGQTIN